MTQEQKNARNAFYILIAIPLVILGFVYFPIQLSFLLLAILTIGAVIIWSVLVYDAFTEGWK